MPDYSWIKTELGKVFPEADLNQGVDLNRDGTLQDNERIADFNKNDIVGDRYDWISYYYSNESAIKSLGGIFKWSENFKPDNPVNDAFSIESKIVSPEEIEKAYQAMDKALSEVNELIHYFPSFLNKPEVFLYMIYMTIGRYWFFRVLNYEGELFTRNINDGALDCDGSSLAVLAVAHEFGSPVYMVNVPDHAFIRWDDGSSKAFDMDFGSVTEDDDYREKFNISQISIDNGVYLKNLDHTELVSGFYFNVCHENIANGDYEEAVKNCNEALEYDSENIFAYNNMSNAKIELGDFKGAIKNCNASLQLDPSDAAAYNNKGIAESKLGSIKQARKDLKHAHELAPDKKFVYYNLISLGLIPDLNLTIYPRYKSNDADSLDARLAVDLAWPAINMGDKVHAGPKIELGYGAASDHHMLDLSAGFEFIFDAESDGSLSIEAGAGYNFLAGGDDSKAPLTKGAFFQYGLRFVYPVSDSFGISISLLAEHDMLKPQDFAILPGVGFKYITW